MPDIRIVCLSDLHLGEEDSLLTNVAEGRSGADPLCPSPVLERLAAGVRDLLARNASPSPGATLILNGDILELALARTHEAAMAFERFIEQLLPPDGTALFERVVYVPGNHDHHLWETARETQYVQGHLAGRPPGEALAAPWHATCVFDGPDRRLPPSVFLTSLVQRHPHLRDLVVEVAYPNFGLRSADGRRQALFHHGHFIEALYLLMSHLKTLFFQGAELPTRVYDLEAENFAWIDFFWSTMGRSGEAGARVERVYELIRDPGSQAFRELSETFARNLAQRYDLPVPGKWLERKVVERALEHVVRQIGGRERARPGAPLSPESERGLWSYLTGPLPRQIFDEEGDELNTQHTTFVFGHTHKPFQQRLPLPGYRSPLEVFNSGGWVVENITPRPGYGGAVVLLDEELNAASLRLYQESSDRSAYQARIEGAGEESEFVGELRGRLEQAPELWRELGDAAFRALGVRARNMAARHRDGMQGARPVR